jgi:hypothetical protein
MTFTLEPAAAFAQLLSNLIIKATFDPANEWFFYDGVHTAATMLEQNVSNTWAHDNFVALNDNREIFGYFEGQWQRPVDIISSFRAINFQPKRSRIFVKALFSYFIYLFENRGCQVLNWAVAIQNRYAMHQYERFVRNYCGHKVGIRHHSAKSYTGKISDINLYEITRDEYFDWKKRNFKVRS